MALTLNNYLSHLQSKGIKYEKRIFATTWRNNKSFHDIEVNFKRGEKDIMLIFDSKKRIQCMQISEGKGEHESTTLRFFSYLKKNIFKVSSQILKGEKTTPEHANTIIHNNDGKVLQVIPSRF